jgi:hypothetical protein
MTALPLRSSGTSQKQSEIHPARSLLAKKTPLYLSFANRRDAGEAEDGG